jgi:hypothetical protein
MFSTRIQCLAVFTSGRSIYSMAQPMTRAGQKAYLYYFAYAEAGKRAPPGAYHGLSVGE